MKNYLICFYSVGFCILLGFFCHANEDPATEAAASIRKGVSLVERRLAVDLLIGLKEVARPYVYEMAREDDQIKVVAALEVLAGSGGKAADFRRFLNDPRYEVRKAAAEGILNSNDGALAVDDVIPLLDDSFWPVRRAAVKAIAAFPKKGTASNLLGAMSDPEPWVRVTAIPLLVGLNEDISNAELTAATDGLTMRELCSFLKAALPLVREDNLLFFKEIAETHKERAAGVLALSVWTAKTRIVPGDWIPVLIKHHFSPNKDSADAAGSLLALAGDSVTPYVRAVIVENDESGAERFQIQSLSHLLLFVLGDNALPYLEKWILEPSFSNTCRQTLLETVFLQCTDKGIETLIRLFPELDGELKEKIVQKATALVQGPLAKNTIPILNTALGGSDPVLKKKAYSAWCLHPSPPIERLARIFREEKDIKLRSSFLMYLVNAAERKHLSEIVEKLFYEEIAEKGGAVMAAVSQFRKVSSDLFKRKAMAPMIELLAKSRDPSDRETILSALISINLPESDRVVAAKIDEAIAGKESLDLEYLVMQLDTKGGEYTLDLLQRLYPDAPVNLKKRIFRTLIKRSNPWIVEYIDEIFTDSGVAYRRSILEEIAPSGLSERCEDFLRKVLLQEKDRDLLASAIDASPLSLLKEQEARLIKMAGLESEMDTAEAVFNALGRLGGEESINFLRDKATSFIDAAKEADPYYYDSPDADLALLASMSLAAAGDEQAPKLLAGLLFIHARGLRPLRILSLWNAESSGGVAGRVHTWGTTILKGLLLFDDNTVEQAVQEEIDQQKKDGRLYRCGDALFCALYRSLIFKKDMKGRCPGLANCLAELTLRCAPSFSPSDFRIHKIRADIAVKNEDHAEAAKEMRRALHIMRFYPLAKAVVRNIFPSPDPFEGYFPAAALASEMHFQQAMDYQIQGLLKEADVELLKAERISPFRR